MSQRIYRDPVHNIIPLREDNAEGRLMVQLVDAVEFQRLRRIKQLGLGLYTYQGAEHSRFTHSLGALHLMTRILGQLSDRTSDGGGVKRPLVWNGMFGLPTGVPSVTEPLRT